MENIKCNYLILGDDFLSLYGFTIYHGKEKYFTINNKQDKKFAIPKDKIIMAIQQEVAQHESPSIRIVTDERFKDVIDETSISPQLTKNQKITIEQLIKKYHNEFGLGKYSLGKITKHPVEITLNINKPYPPILKKNPYPASPRNRIEIEKHIDELLQMKVIRKVGNNETVDIATPVIIAWHNGKSRL
ncbi:hypothetical protein CROQUDRAFT_55246, partial [Cronartium quercuum f. sp. fusiforme G11]